MMMIMIMFTRLRTRLEKGNHESGALPDSDYLSLLRYLSFSVLDNRILADNLSQLPKRVHLIKKGRVFIEKWDIL